MATDLYEELAVPYIAVLYPIEVNQEWIRRAEYPELPGCVAEAATAIEAMEQLEARRIQMLVEMHFRGEVPPRPRPPLKSGLASHGSVDVDRIIERVADSRQGRR